MRDREPETVGREMKRKAEMAGRAENIGITEDVPRRSFTAGDCE